MDATARGRSSRNDDLWYLSGLPGTRGWVANLRSHPRFLFHVRHGAQADLWATAAPVTGPERRRVLTAIVSDLNQAHNPARISQPTDLEHWLDGSPLVEIAFDAYSRDQARVPSPAPSSAGPRRGVGAPS